MVPAGALGAAGLLVPRLLARRALAAVVAVLALVGTVGASTAYAAVTAATPHSGSIVTAGPDTGTGGPGGSTRPGGAASARDGQADRVRGRSGPGTEQASPELVALLRAAGTRWAAATTGSMNQATLQLDSGVPVMPMGGFMGSDPAPTLAQFQEYVATGQVRYLIAVSYTHLTLPTNREV